MNEEKVSIIIPIYNVEKFLKKCIDSVIEQSYQNLEIILIDDGSTDLSGNICDEYLKRDSRIKVFHQNNQGMSGARNTGLEYFTGDYITFIDSDDFVDKDMILEMLKILKETNSDISVCGTIFCSETEKELMKKEIPQKKEFGKEKQIEELILNKEISTTCWGKLYKREILKDFKFPIKKYHEDLFALYKLLDRSNKTIVVDKSLYYYRQVDGSIMHSFFKVKHLDAIEGILERISFLKKKYPKYIKYDYGNLVYNCCKIYERMIISSYEDKEIERYLQNIIRKYIFYFLIYSDSALKTKLFAILNLINMDISKKVYKKIKG